MDGLYDDSPSYQNEKQTPNVAPTTTTDRDKYYSIYNEYDYNVSFEEGIIHIHSDFDEGFLRNLIIDIRSIQKWRKLENKQIGDPITIMINSPGGDIFEMFGAIDFIRTRKEKINVVARGQACSAGAMLLVCGTGVRAASKHTTIMLHQASTGGIGKLSDIRASLDHVQQLEEMHYELLEECTTRDKAFWKDKLRDDYYLTASEAQKLGVIDKII